MILPALLSPEAEADLHDAAAWHEQQSHGLGEELVSEVRNTLVRVGDQPKGGVMVISRSRILFACVAVLTLAVTSALLVPNSWRESRPRFGWDESIPIPGTHVRKTREQIVAELGEPKSEWQGLYGLPPASFATQHAGAKTLYYEWRSGRFYASIEEVAGQWVCFDSTWVPEGCIID